MQIQFWIAILKRQQQSISNFTKLDRISWNLGENWYSVYVRTLVFSLDTKAHTPGWGWMRHTDFEKQVSNFLLLWFYETVQNNHIIFMVYSDWRIWRYNDHFSFKSTFTHSNLQKNWKTKHNFVDFTEKIKQIWKGNWIIGLVKLFGGKWVSFKATLFKFYVNV